MYDVVRLVDIADGAGRDRLVADLRDIAAACDADRHLVAPTLPGVRNGGDVLLRLRFADRGGWTAHAGRFDEVLHRPGVTRVNGASYTGAPVAENAAAGTVYRTLLLRVRPDADESAVRDFERDLRLLPRYVRTIHSWQLSRVEDAVGTSPWTHVFEQEFTDLDGLTGPYLMHPIHWAHVDRWFDPECPEVLVRDRVCHSFCLNSPTAPLLTVATQG